MRIQRNPNINYSNGLSAHYVMLLGCLQTFITWTCVHTCNCMYVEFKTINRFVRFVLLFFFCALPIHSIFVFYTVFWTSCDISTSCCLSERFYGELKKKKIVENISPDIQLCRIDDAIQMAILYLFHWTHAIQLRCFIWLILFFFSLAKIYIFEIFFVLPDRTLLMDSQVKMIC